MKKILYISGTMFLYVGLLTLFLYINLFTFGYTFKEYIKYIARLPEFIYVIIGIILIIISIRIKEKNI